MKNIRCNELNFMRDFEGNSEDQKKIYDILRDSIIEQNLIFFGGYASNLYGKYMPKEQQKQLLSIPDFDVLSEDANASGIILRDRLKENGIKNVKILKRDAIGENIPLHYEIKVVTTQCVLSMNQLRAIRLIRFISIIKQLILQQ